jgi:enoyl-[acyl-carrier protein] reductase I
MAASTTVASMSLLTGKRIVITGVLTKDSIAFEAARLAQQQGAEVVLTSVGRAMSLTRRTARRLEVEPEVLEFDAADESHVAGLHDALAERYDRIDGALHAIGFAPPSCLSDGFLDAPWDDVAVALKISTFSLKSLAAAVAPLMENAPSGGSIVGLDFDAAVAWPVYEWMGVAKAGLESTSRYLARELGPRNIRVNLVAAGPLKTTAAKSIDGFEQFEGVWNTKAPLGWDVTNTEAAGRACVALFSDWFPATTGEIIHVDGGYHAIGA